jgi:general stress protein 26
VVLLGTVSREGEPNIKALSKVAAEGIKDVWCITHSSTRRVVQLRHDPKACVYFLDQARFQGLMLVGKVEIRQDQETKRRMWQPQFEHYFRVGPTDPDYCVLHFVGQRANFAWGLINVDIDLQAAEA